MRGWREPGLLHLLSFPAPLSPAPHLALFSRCPLNAPFLWLPWPAPHPTPAANCFPQPNPIFHPQLLFLSPPRSVASPACLSNRSNLALDPLALAPSEPLNPPPAPLFSPPFQRDRFPEPRIPPEAGTNPIRKSSRLLRAMNRLRRVRCARQLLGLASRTRTRSSSPQLATHSHDEGQPCQAMLGAGARGRPGGGAGRCYATTRPRPPLGEPEGLGPRPLHPQAGGLGAFWSRPFIDSRSHPPTRRPWPGALLECHPAEGGLAPPPAGRSGGVAGAGI